MNPVIVFLFGWAIVATGLFLRALGAWDEERAKAERARSDAMFWRVDAGWERDQKERHMKAERDWFYRTRVAHARRKRLQKITDRLFRRVGSAEFDRACLLGEVDRRDEEIKSQAAEIKRLSECYGSEVLARTEFRYRNEELKTERDAALRAEGDIRRQHVEVSKERDELRADRNSLARGLDDYEAMTASILKQRDEARAQLIDASKDRARTIARLRKPNRATTKSATTTKSTKKGKRS